MRRTDWIELKVRIFRFLFLVVIANFAVISLANASVIELPFQSDNRKLPTLDSHFIFPNEWLGAIYKNEIEKMNGVAITTGTFRAFQEILHGNFTWVIIVDVDPLVMSFNRLNYAAILSAKTLKEYLENFPGFYEEQYGRYPPEYDASIMDYSNSDTRHPLFKLVHERFETDGLISPRDYPAASRKW